MVTSALTSLQKDWPIVLQLQPVLALEGDQFFDFCQLNRDWRFERTATGDLIIMAPTGSETGGYNFDLTVELGIWARRDGTGKGFDSSTGFTLPNGAIRSPDAAWILRDRWEAIAIEQRRKFAPICPDFVLELRSVSDALEPLQTKMQEYLDNGARLGWLLDRQHRRVYIYRPGQPVETLENPVSMSGESVLTGFVLPLSLIG